MPRSRLIALHAGASAIALLAICAFWLSALVAEFVTDHAGTVSIRMAIFYALPVLVIALSAAGASGSKLAGRSGAPRIAAKRTRMKAAAANGLLILVPSAIFLAWKADIGVFDTSFTMVQLVELIAGGANIILLGLNMRAGLEMRGRRLRLPRQGAIS